VPQVRHYGKPAAISTIMPYDLRASFDGRTMGSWTGYTARQGRSLKPVIHRVATDDLIHLLLQSRTSANRWTDPCQVLLHFRKEVAAPNYLQEPYPVIDLMFVLCTEGKLFRKTACAKGNFSLTGTHGKAEFEQSLIFKS
jgi:hypothetical protein